MQKVTKKDRPVVGPGAPRTDRLSDKTSRLYLGIDIGSISSDVVVFDQNNDVVFSDYSRTMGKPIETVRRQLGMVLEQIDASEITSAAVTGSAGRFLAELIEIPFTNEVPAQATAIASMHPNLKQCTLIEMGGQDSKIIFLSQQDGRLALKDFALNTVCAAGTGSFLDQQAQRLGIEIEDQFGALALQSTSVPQMAGRCSVFAKSDMIHLQQQATPTCDIIAGLCLALARSLKGNLGRGRDFVKPVIFTGGVAANIGVVRAFENVLDLTEGQIIVPDLHFFTGAMGAVLCANENTLPPGKLTQCIETIDHYLAHRRSALENAPRRPQLSKPSLPVPASKVHDNLLQRGTPVDAYIGIDVGSISTNVVVMDEERRVLAKEYLMTAGNPIEAIRKGLRLAGEKVRGKVNILGAATTGSGRYLTGDVIGADIVINEITAQAAGAAIVCPEVDTIFEIGGQDSKYISLENGVVVDFEMNHACAAGTGSFLEEQAQRLGIDIKGQFGELAFRSNSPIRLGERCTVFIESDLLSYQQQGASTEDLVAGLSYSIVANYLNRVVGRRRIGKHICFQGGTAFNHGVWAAFEKITGRKIMVPDHHEVTGALGAASIAAEHMKRLATVETKTRSRFKGFDNLVSADYSVDSFTCRHCSNDCEIKRVKIPGSDPLFYGSRCDRYNLKKKTVVVDTDDLFEYRYDKLLECANIDEPESACPQDNETIGIPQSLVSWQLLPLFSTFFKSLGFRVVLSNKTDKKVIRRGIECVTAQTCFPVKVAYGHVADLIEKGVDHVFLPSIVTMTPVSDRHGGNQLCPYVQSFPYQVASAFEGKLGQTRILAAVLRMGEGRRLLMSTFKALGSQLKAPASKIRKAIEKALAEQQGFENTLKAKGAEFLSELPDDSKAFVLISRPYNGCDDALNLQLSRKLAALGVKLIPMDMLDLQQTPLSDESLHSQVYWTYGQKILRAGEIVKRDPRLFAVYLSNFSCGPDSFIQTFFKDLMDQKPCLQLELDEHSADAGVVTRLEAFLESLKHYKNGRLDDGHASMPIHSGSLLGKRKLYVPYMGDSSYGFAASFRAHGQQAEVMPISNEADLVRGRKFTTGKECLPCAITIGEMLNVIAQDGFDPDAAAFFMPAASGPCRFGMYNCMQKLVLKYAGAHNVPIIAPNQGNSFYKEFVANIEGSSKSAFMKCMWAATMGVELLHKTILRIRPFAKDRDKAQHTYKKAVAEWVALIETRPTTRQMVDFMASAAFALSCIELDKTVAKPRIGIVGEIYVRNHPFANQSIIERLEHLGASCDLASVAEWVYYTNFIRTRRAVRGFDIRDWFSNSIQDFYQRKIEKTIAEPLEKKFGPLAEEPVKRTLDAARPYMHHSFVGEAILSVGKIVEYHHHGFGGVVNVMPFSCMPSTIVSTQTMRISSQCGEMPVLNLSFDGQDDPALTTRLEAFVDQVRHKKTTTVTALVG